MSLATEALDELLLLAKNVGSATPIERVSALAALIGEVNDVVQREDYNEHSIRSREEQREDREFYRKHELCFVQEKGTNGN